jgi:hypothetical protein
VEENILLKAKQKKQLDYLVMTEGNFTATNPDNVVKSNSAGPAAAAAGADVGSIFSAQGLKSLFGVGDTSGNVAGASGGGMTDIGGGGGAATSSAAQSQGSGAGATAAAVVSNRDIEAAMAAVEDDDDFKMVAVAKSEETEMDKVDFDENADITVNNEDDNDEAGNDTSLTEAVPTSSSTSSGPPASQVQVPAATATTTSTATAAATATAAVSEEKDSEMEFAALQATAGFNIENLENSLRPVEKYALSFRLYIDVFLSMFAISEQQRLQSLHGPGGAQDQDQTYLKMKQKLKTKLKKHKQLQGGSGTSVYSENGEETVPSGTNASGDGLDGEAEGEGEIDIESIEQLKEEEEYRAFAAGELLGTAVGTERGMKAMMRWYGAERRKRANELRRRAITGESWKLYVDSITKVNSQRFCEGITCGQFIMWDLVL